MSKLHLYTHKQPPFSHPLGLEVYIQWYILSLGRKMNPETKPIQTLEADSGPQGIPIPGPWSIWLKGGLHVGMGSEPLGLLTLWGKWGQRRSSQSPLDQGAQRRQPSFSSPKEILPSPRSVHKSDPMRWTKFRAQAQSLSEQEKIVRRKKSYSSW